MDGIEVLDENHPKRLSFEHGAALTDKEKATGMPPENKGWFSQGGIEVHWEDNDMLAPEAEPEMGNNGVKPLHVRIRGFQDIDKGNISVEDLVLKGHLQWDIGRLEKAADLVVSGRSGPA